MQFQHKAQLLIGRIYGEVKSTEKNELNNKYLKVDIYSSKNKLLGTKYLKLENLSKGEAKKFAVDFKAENVKKYDIEIVDNTEETEEKAKNAKLLYSNNFSDEAMKGGMLLALVLGLAFGL